MNEIEIAAQIAALRKQLPQWNRDSRYAYDVSKVFGGPTSYAEQNNPGQWEGFNQGLNLKEQEAERLEEVRRQMMQGQRRY